MFLNISGFQYNLNHKALEIYVSGCLGECHDCHNKELWDFSIGEDYQKSLLKVQKKVDSGLVDIFWILGGDPLDQNYIDLIFFLKKLKEFNKKIFLWTRYQLENIPDEILNLIDIIKIGEFIKDDTPYVDEKTGIKLISSNQKIIFLNKN